MSTNCVSCVKNKRTGNDLLCDQCRLEDARQVSEKRKEMLLRIARERNAWQKRAEEAERQLKFYIDSCNDYEKSLQREFAKNDAIIRAVGAQDCESNAEVLKFANDLQKRLAAAETRAQEAERRLEASADAAELAIQHYRCHYTVIDGDGDALPLVDKLTNGDSSEDGQQEMEMLVDVVCGAILHSTPDIKSSLVDARERLAAAEGINERWCEAFKKAFFEPGPLGYRFWHKKSCDVRNFEERRCECGYSQFSEAAQAALAKQPGETK